LGYYGSYAGLNWAIGKDKVVIVGKKKGFVVNVALIEI